MAHFYLDHDVSAHTALALRQHGHNVLTTRELHRERQADYGQLLTAAEQEQIFVTHNERDFVLLHGSWRLWSRAWRIVPQHSGILVIPQRLETLSQWTSIGAARELTNYVQAHPSLENELYNWRRGANWKASSQ